MDNVKHIDIRPVAGGVIVPVKVAATSSRDKIVGVLGDSLKITTSAAPEKGKANRAVGKTLARSLGVDRKFVTLTSGPASERKKFRIDGISPDAIRQKLREM